MNRAYAEMIVAGLVIAGAIIALSFACNLAPRVEAQNFAPQCVYDAKQVKWVCSDVSEGPTQDVQSGGDSGAGASGDASSGQ